MPLRSYRSIAAAKIGTNRHAYIAPDAQRRAA
jgi:hypothetical protein